MNLPGALIDGKYTIIARLREGGMGTIYKVHHNLLDEIRVIKFMRPTMTGDPDLHRRFLQEAKLVTKLKHHNIASVYDFAMGEDMTAYIVMEYVEGVNLVELARSFGTVHYGLALEIARQTVDALSYLHRKSIVHRDVSPDNIMVMLEDHRPVVKLIDLGIAKALDAAESVTKTGFFLGKIKYASPEQLGMLQSGEIIDARSDLYSLGVVLYELMTGKLPFSGGNPQALVAGHLFHEPLSFEESDPEELVPPPVRELILRALTKKREERFASAEEFLHAIVRVQAELDPDYSPAVSRLPALIEEVHPTDNDHTFTPSAQARMNEHFAAMARTPSATHPGDWSETQAMQESTRIATNPSVPIRDSAPPTLSADARPTLMAPLPPEAPRPKSHAKTIAAVAIALIALAAAGMYFVRDRKPPEPEKPVVAAATPPLVQTATPSAVATAIAEPPMATTTQATESVAPGPATTGVVQPDPALRQSAISARRAADSARSRARAIGATSAAEFVRAEQLRRNGDQLFARAAYADAAAAFGAAAHLFGSARPGQIAAVEPPRPLPAEPVAPQREEIAPTVAAIPVPQPPPPQPRETPRNTASAEEEIRTTLLKYETAQESLDAKSYVGVFPSANLEKVTTAFRQFRSQQLDVTVRKIDVASNGRTATVTAVEERVATPRVGTEQRIRGERTFSMEKRGETWVITAIR